MNIWMGDFDVMQVNLTLQRKERPMSRTRKDRPDWVQENDPRNREDARENHFCGATWVPIKFKEVETTRYNFWFRAPETSTRKVAVLWTSGYKECDINEKGYDRTCVFKPVRGWSWVYPGCCEPSQDDRRQFNREVRAESKTLTKRMMDQYNATGEVDDYVFTPLRKHAAFGGGYLD